jgi:hypothetical protein
VSIFLVLVAIATSVWRQRKLRSEFDEFRRESSKQNDALHRELIDLRRQITAMPHPAAQPEQPSVRATDHAANPAEVVPRPPGPATLVDATVEESAHAQFRLSPQEPAKLSATAPLPGTEPKPEFDLVRKREAASPAEAAPVSPPPARDSAPSLPPLAATPQLPSVPATPPAAEPATPDSPKPLAPPVPAAPKTPSPERVMAPARPIAPAPMIPPHPPTPTPTVQERLRAVSRIEETLGTNWLNKLGIVLVVIGVASFGILKLGQLGPAGKVILCYVVALGLLGAGIYFERRERYHVLGHTGIGGGWALLFWVTYALNHVQAMRVLGSETSDLFLMLAVAIAMVVHTLRYNSQLVTGLAFLLAYTTVALSHDNVYSLSAGVILALGLVTIVVKKGWFELELFGILSSYLNHFYWLYRLLGPSGAEGHAFAEYQASTAMLLFYWLTFRVSYVIRKVKAPVDEHVSTAAALLNTLLLLFVMKFQSVHPELAFFALLGIGAVEFHCGQLPQVKRRREAFIILTAMGAALMLTAVPFRYSGNNVVILWVIGAEALLVAGVTVSEVVFRRLGLLGGVLAGGHLIAVELNQLVTTRSSTEDLALAPGIVFALCALVFYLNALGMGRKWAWYFDEGPDSKLLTVHSYLGAFAAVASAWALFSRDWTALAFAALMLVLAVLGRRLHSIHLQVQYGLIGLLTSYRVVVVNLHADSPAHVHSRVRLLTLPLLAAAFYSTAWLAQLRDESDQRRFRGFFSTTGTALVVLLIYFEVPDLWQPLAAIVFAVLLAEAAARLQYRVLAWHSHALTALAVAASINADPFGQVRWHDMPVQAFAALPVVMGAYGLAKRIPVANPGHAFLGSMVCSWTAAGLMAWILGEVLPAPWIAVGWIVFAVLLVLTTRWIRYQQLGWQGSALAFGAFGRTLVDNFPLQDKLWQGFSVRLVTITLVAAGLYAISRRASAPGSPYRKVSALVHTSAATALLALLAWYEAPGGWLAAVWAVFALVLALVDRRFELDDLGGQAHVLAALTLLRSVTVNLYVGDTWHGISVRLLSLATVSVVFYALSRVVRMPEDWRAHEFQHIYSWAGSTLVSLLMWYELQPLSIALGWAIFGLVLFEYGLLRNVKQFRFQSYVAFMAAFVRIFFANLTAGSTDQFWGPRAHTVLPLALIFFFVHAQLATEERSTAEDRRLRFDAVLAYLGTGTVVALLYFQFNTDWVVTAWAVVVFALLAVARFTNRPLFLGQGLLLSFAVLVRGVVHNLFGASYFTGSDWTGRYAVLGSAILLLFATLPLASRLRNPNTARSSSQRATPLGAVARHPEQVLFFVPTILLTLLLALKMRAGMVTVAWGVEAVLIVLLALFVGERSYRLTGLFLLLACVAKIMLRDAWGLAPRDRYITFIILGMALLLVSFLYSKYRDTIRQFL